MAVDEQLRSAWNVDPKTAKAEELSRDRASQIYEAAVRIPCGALLAEVDRQLGEEDQD